jgi:hypothetical protein
LEFPEILKIILGVPPWRRGSGNAVPNATGVASIIDQYNRLI